MKLDKRFLEYYFFHYHELCAHQMRIYGMEQGFKIPSKRKPQSFARSNSNQPLDLFTLRMIKIVELTFKSFQNKKKEVLKMKYFMMLPRFEICSRLEISARTYHRYITEIMEYAEYLVCVATESMQGELPENLFSAEKFNNFPWEDTISY